MNEIQSEIKDMKQYVIKISKNVDELMYEKEITSIIKLNSKNRYQNFSRMSQIYI